MNYLQKKKLAFMSTANQVKGFVRSVSGILPLTLEGCVDEESIIDYKIYGQSVQDGEPTPNNPIEVKSVGEYNESIGKYEIPVTVSGNNLISPQKWVSGTNESGFNINENQNYITACGENYVEATLPAWNAIASELINISEVSKIGFKINRNSTIDDYNIYVIAMQFYDKEGKKIGSRSAVNASAMADIEYAVIKDGGMYKPTAGNMFSIPNGSTHFRLAVMSRAKKNEGLRIYDFYATKETDTGFEPYCEPITTNIYLDKPLGQGEAISYKKDSLPSIPTHKGTSIITVGTTIQPSQAEIEYYSNVKE